VENGASWVPYCVYKLQRNKERRQNTGAGIGGPDYELGQGVLRDNRMYVTCQIDEDVPYLLTWAGAHNLMIGSDYAHSDPSQEGHFPSLLRDWAGRGQISTEDVERILYANPKECYGL
jgi:hypothetical protein